MAKQQFWIGEKALFLDGKLPNISPNTEIPAEVLNNSKFAKAFDKHRKKGLIVDSLDEKTTANIAVRRKTQELNKLLTENTKLSERIKQLENENANLKIQIRNLTMERDKAIRQSLGGK